MKIPNPTARAKREFAFLESTELDMIGATVGVPQEVAADGYSALVCWYAKDAHGVSLPCCEPVRLAKVNRAKASWNLQVKMWAEDLADGCILRMDELREYCAGLPDWVFRATVQQAARIALSSIGYIPTFLTP